MLKCAGCGRNIEGVYLKALGRNYHEACFVCHCCGVSFGRDPFVVHKRKPYHPDCLSKALELRCAACGELVGGNYTEALGKVWHPEHFVCAHCGKLISGNLFSVHQDQPYHEACLREVLGLRCAACGELVGGNYIEALGKVWHPEHFCCSHCHKPLPEEFMAKGENPYCHHCYEALFLEKCAICSRPLSGTYLVNQWGEKFCSEHDGELPQCLSCQRLICPALTGGGVQYADGRWVCSLCRKTAVDRMKEARLAFKRVLQFLASLGVDLLQRKFPLELVDRDTLLSLSRYVDKDNTFGVTSKTFVIQSGQQVDRWVKKISILRGLPWEQFTMVVAHELGHAWLCLEKIDLKDRSTEEGFCELLAYLWLEQLGTDSAKVRMAGMKKNPNRVYGRGFRRVLRWYKKEGLRGVIEAVGKV